MHLISLSISFLSVDVLTFNTGVLEHCICGQHCDQRMKRVFSRVQTPIIRRMEKTIIIGIIGTEGKTRGKKNENMGGKREIGLLFSLSFLIPFFSLFSFLFSI